MISYTDICGAVAQRNSVNRIRHRPIDMAYDNSDVKSFLWAKTYRKKDFFSSATIDSLSPLCVVQIPLSAAIVISFVRVICAIVQYLSFDYSSCSDSHETLAMLL